MNTDPELVRVLVVDDQAPIRHGFARVLGGAGYDVTEADDVPTARERLAAGEFDVVLTDLGLPSGSGLDVLEAARAIDPALPVVFVTGQGDVETAQSALAHGALRYLVKPVASARLLAVVEEACRARSVSAGRSGRFRALDRDLEHVVRARQFESALDRLWVAVQPVVSLVRRRAVAYEALVRSDEPALARPDLLLAAAEELGRLHDLGRRIRELVVARIAEQPTDVDLLVNLHPEDLSDEQLYDPDAPLSQVAHRVILEITERASLDHVVDVHDRIATLRRLGYRIAIDDLGAGYGSLSAIALVRPDLVKIDMSLVRNIDGDPMRTRMVRSIGSMCQQLGIPWLCEGVETAEELHALVSIGCDLVQGYLLGRPARTKAPVPEAVLARVPRPARPTRPSQKVALGTVAQGLCREALALAVGVPDPTGGELRTVLVGLREVLELIGD